MCCNQQYFRDLFKIYKDTSFYPYTSYQKVNLCGPSIFAQMNSEAAFLLHLIEIREISCEIIYFWMRKIRNNESPDSPLLNAYFSKYGFVIFSSSGLVTVIISIHY